MTWNPKSSKLSEHRERLLKIAIAQARKGGLRSLKRETLAAEAGVSTGTYSFVMGKRDEMLTLVQEAAKVQGIELSY